MAVGVAQDRLAAPDLVLRPRDVDACRLGPLALGVDVLAGDDDARGAARGGTREGLVEREARALLGADLEPAVVPIVWSSLTSIPRTST